MSPHPEITGKYIFKYSVLEGEYLCPIQPLVFFWVDIGLDTLIYIYRYSDSLSW